ncbi:B-box domain protein 31-like [Cucurbita pepo subsp. pepo]|uniref:B-box domain protein 31-like n=1 Tax=Cucurbita pepo subsp. pepo TaxID=3664 RepID=UPI000C9D9B56|nr:B-box domain protein 31-like [Cucurbita pepo subsp. pepo]
MMVIYTMGLSSSGKYVILLSIYIHIYIYKPYGGMPHLHLDSEEEEEEEEAMCRGVVEQRSHGGCREFSAAEKGGDSAEGAVLMCELCDSRASLYCQADDAYLCRKCDKWVHGANFLALRHIRCILCNVCQKLTHKYLMGTSTQVLLPTIVTCNQPPNDCNDNRNLSTCCSVRLKTPVLFL